MNASAKLVITRVVLDRVADAPVEMCEHKGIGHPDTICDGVAEAVSRALCRAYLDAFGAVQHYNVDKALLIGGESAPRFGGGGVVTPMRLIVCGRATALPGVELGEFIRAAAADYLATTLHCEPGLIHVEPAVLSGSPNLTRVIGTGAAEPRANDTSFGAGFAPYSRLEKSVLQTADLLRSDDFRHAFPAAGDDYKIMGLRRHDETRLTIALALIDREVSSVAHCFEIKSQMVEYLRQTLDSRIAIVINALDDPAAADESGIYLTVTGLSAEHGDDGQVGRGNRVGGLITPLRPMSLEAAAGKNAVAHVGKIYNALAFEVAQAIARADTAIVDVSVQILSTIGDPVATPSMVAITLRVPDGADPNLERNARAIAENELGRIGELSSRILRGEIRLF